MRDAHQHSNFLLQAVDLALLLGRASSSPDGPTLKVLDCIAHAGALFRAQVDGGKVALAQRAVNCVLLAEAIAVAGAWIAEDETRDVEDGYFITIVELAALVAAHEAVIDICAVARQVFQHSDTVSILVLMEEEAVAVADGGNVDDAVCGGRVSDGHENVCCEETTHHTRDACRRGNHQQARPFGPFFLRIVPPDPCTFPDRQCDGRRRRRLRSQARDMRIGSSAPMCPAVTCCHQAARGIPTRPLPPHP